MYRIEFNPETGKFIIEVLRFSLFWTAVTGAEFETFDQAQSRVAAIGLDKLYADKSANRYREHIARGQQQFERGIPA